MDDTTIINKFDTNETFDAKNQAVKAVDLNETRITVFLHMCILQLYSTTVKSCDLERTKMLGQNTYGQKSAYEANFKASSFFIIFTN